MSWEEAGRSVASRPREVECMDRAGEICPGPITRTDLLPDYAAGRTSGLMIEGSRATVAI